MQETSLQSAKVQGCLNDEEHLHEPLEPCDEDFEDLATAVVRPPKWVIKNLLPVGITFLAAPPKAGKSTITVGMACLVAAYKCSALPNFISEVPNDGPVFMFSAEAMAGEIRYIAEQGLGVHLTPNESILVARRPEDFRIDTDIGRNKMLYWLRARHPRLVILDPLRNFHAEDENDSGALLRMLAPLRRWAVDNDSAFVVVHHTNKPKEGQTTFSANDMRGSSAMFGIADGVLICTPKQLEQQLKIDATFKRARGWEYNIQLGAYDFKDVGGTEVLSSNDQKVLQAYSKGELFSVDDVASKLNLRPDIVREMFVKLKRNKRIENINGEWALI